MSAWLDVGAAVFGAAISARHCAYACGLARTRRASRPVISVGNLAVGGTGKTPFVVLLARLLEARGAHVAVLSRGYGARERSRSPLIVSARGTVMARVEASGDEPQLIARSTSASVVVCPRRDFAARVAVQELGADVLVLDDGFQHRQLARDLDIVLLDAREPFGNGKLLPAGPLRETRRALGRAHLLVLNHGPDVSAVSPEIPTGLPQLEVRVEVRGGTDLRNTAVGLVAAIARPERFERTVVGLGARVVHRTWFADHHWIDRGELERACEAAQEAGAERILTTEKDWVRLPPVASPIFPVVIDLVPHRGVASLERALLEIFP